MSERRRNILTVALLLVMATVLMMLIVTNPTAEDRVRSIGERIKCPVCQGESIAISPSQIAQDMMALVAERVADGASDEEIIDELMLSYSGAVLLDPPASGNTLVLWIAPFAALVIGAGVIVWWRRHPGKELPQDTAAGQSRARRLAPLLLLVGAFAVIVVVAGSFIQDRQGPASGAADLAEGDLDDVSEETMEAVIEANADHPQVNGMRLALAERYYEEGDFRSAFPHYLAVAESAEATDAQAVTALIRLGWMSWEGNAEAETAVGLFDQALAIDSDSDTARYLKARVLWCGTGDNQAAAALLQDILSDPDLATDSRQTVRSDLDAIESGAECA